jgi:5-methylcytosine-specific restriction endonuclease McrA
MVKKRRALSQSVRITVYGRDGGVCRYCGQPVSPDEFHVDHYLAASRGGPDSLDNLVLSCRPCNYRKSCLPAREAGMHLPQRPDPDETVIEWRPIEHALPAEVDGRTPCHRPAPWWRWFLFGEVRAKDPPTP